MVVRSESFQWLQWLLDKAFCTEVESQTPVGKSCIWSHPLKRTSAPLRDHWEWFPLSNVTAFRSCSLKSLLFYAGNSKLPLHWNRYRSVSWNFNMKIQLARTTSRCLNCWWDLAHNLLWPQRLVQKKNRRPVERKQRHKSLLKAIWCIWLLILGESGSPTSLLLFFLALQYFLCIETAWF